jgi:branched-chain amino acid transport system permease protein
MLLLQLIVNGFCMGSLYALLGIGFTVIYSSTRIFHIAYGAVIITSQYIFYLWLKHTQYGTLSAFIVALLFAAGFGITIQVLLYQPLQRRGVSLGGLMIISLGLFYVVQNLLAILFTVRTLTLTQSFPPMIELGPIRLSILYLEVVAVVGIVVLLFILFLRKTEIGILLRALADNPNLVLITGSSPMVLFILATAIGSAIGALGGGFMVLDVGVRPDIGFTILLKAAISSIVGGVGSVQGALVAGIILGILESVVIWKLPAEWQGVLVFFVLLVLLLWFKEGILTKGLQRREV